MSEHNHYPERWATEQLTKERAVALFDSKLWEDWSDKEIVDFQLFQRLLCIPFNVFHRAITNCLERPVYTHEFAFVSLLQAEYLGDRATPSLQDILDLIPEEKRILLHV